MQFKDVIGQSAIKQRLIASVRDNHVSHAQLFLGPAGSGKLPLALAYAQYILCPNRTSHLPKDAETDTPRPAFRGADCGHKKDKEQS